MLEPEPVRIARLEEAMVSVKGDTRYIRERLDTILWKIAFLCGGLSTVTSVLIVVISKR